jgi:hypothetical protein
MPKASSINSPTDKLSPIAAPIAAWPATAIRSDEFRLISQRMASFLLIEGRLSCRLVCHELEFRDRFRPDLALSHRFASRQRRNRQSLSAVRDVLARLDYADVLAAVTATKARSPTLIGIVWKSA